MNRFMLKRGATRPRSRIAHSLVLILVPFAAFVFAGGAFGATTVPMGNAASFGALSSTAMTNAGGLTVVNGDIGSATSIDAGVTNGSSGSRYLPPASQLTNAQASLLIAYGNAAAATPDHPTITGSNLAGQTLAPGVYNSTATILISGPTALTLDGQGDPNAVFIFQAGSSLTVDPTSSVALVNGAQSCNVFWQVGSSAFLKNSGNVFSGTILALTQITLTDGITVNGRVLARNADVTFIHDVVNTPTCATPAAPVPAPTPGTGGRSLYCTPAGVALNLATGEDKLPPYNTQNLVDAYTDPVTGSKSCTFPVAIVTPPPVTPTPTPPPPPVTTPTPAEKAAKAAAAKAAAAKVAAAKAKKLAAVKGAKTTHVGTARVAKHRSGFTG